MKNLNFQKMKLKLNDDDVHELQELLQQQQELVDKDKNEDNELDEVCDDEEDFINDELDDIEQLLKLERDVELLIDESDKELFEQQLLIDDEDEDAMDDEDEKEQLKLDNSKMMIMSLLKKRNKNASNILISKKTMSKRLKMKLMMKRYLRNYHWNVLMMKIVIGDKKARADDPEMALFGRK